MIYLYTVIIFLSAAAWDFAIANYNIAIRDLKGHLAGKWSVAAYVVGAVGFILAVKITLWLMLPEALGLYAGTRVAVWWKKRKIAKGQSIE